MIIKGTVKAHWLGTYPRLIILLREEHPFQFVRLYNDTTSSLDSKKNIFPLVGYYKNSNIVTNCRTHTDEVVRSGYVARILNGGDGKTEKYGSIWGQEIGVDAHPVFITTDNAVYKLVLMDGTTEVRNGYVNSKKLNLPEPTKNGYKFVGWTNKDSSVTYSSTSVITTDDTPDPNQRRLHLHRMDEQGQLRFLGGQHSHL
jgi:uncharacterized repeat protein (TIGR02543 family)